MRVVSYICAYIVTFNDLLCAATAKSVTVSTVPNCKHFQEHDKIVKSCALGLCTNLITYREYTLVMVGTVWEIGL